MKALLTVCFVGLLFCAEGQLPVNPASAQSGPVETIVCIRHGEKPDDGLGQLKCRGLNRALALPDVLLRKYGVPQFIFAPSTTLKDDKGVDYNYIRPLMTIEPTAVRCGMPVNTQFKFDDITGLESELEKPKYQGTTNFIAWEHNKLDEFVNHLVRSCGLVTNIPAWPAEDYDSIFLVRITRDGDHKAAVFSIEHEDLNNHLSDDCPGFVKGGK